MKKLFLLNNVPQALAVQVAALFRGRYSVLALSDLPERCSTWLPTIQHGGSLMPGFRPNALCRTEICSVDGCGEPYYCKGMCGSHYQINRRRPGETHNLVASKGSGWTDAAGYQRIKIDGVTYMKHRLVMERRLGRALLKSETVRHRNGDRRDNAIGNLELKAGWHGKHQSVEDLVKYAREILDLYG